MFPGMPAAVEAAARPFAGHLGVEVIQLRGHPITEDFQDAHGRRQGYARTSPDAMPCDDRRATDSGGAGAGYSLRRHCEGSIRCSRARSSVDRSATRPPPQTVDGVIAQDRTDTREAVTQGDLGDARQPPQFLGDPLEKRPAGCTQRTVASA